jgi:hypothetical protein
VIYFNHQKKGENKMFFRSGNIKIEFTDGEKETLKKALPILEAIVKKIDEEPWRSLGFDGDTYYERDDVNCAVGILEVLTDDNVEIIIE